MFSRQVKTLLVITIALFSFSVAHWALAIDNQVTAPELKIPIPGMAPFSDVAPSKGNISSSWIAEYIIAIYRYGIGVIGVLAVVMIAIGGVRWIISQGNPSKVSEAKSYITGSITGVALALGSYLMLSMINTELVNFRPLSIAMLEKPDFTSGGGVLTGEYTGKPTFNSNITTYDTLLREAARNNGIDCNLLKAVMMTESAGNPKALSSVSAKGLMQIMDETFATLAPPGSDPFDPKTSIEAGAKYLGQLKKNGCNGASSNSVGCVSSQVKYMAAGYNGGAGCNGPSNSPKCQGKTIWECPANWDQKNPKSYLQTYNYVGKVQANLNQIISNGWGC